MAIESYFFDAVKNDDGTYDRTYNAEDFTNYLSLLVGNGVFPNPSTNLQVTASTGMDVLVQPGSAWIDGLRLINTATLTLTLDSSDLILKRIDRIIFYADYASRKMGIEVLKGESASIPSAPDLTRTDTRYEMSLAQIYINKGVTAITLSDITDTRSDTSVCGYVAGLIQQIDTSTLFEQYQAAQKDFIDNQQQEFDNWLANAKSELETVSTRTYKAVYITADENVSSVVIPSSVGYSSNGLNTLEVYVNGLKLNGDEYRINDDGTMILLSEPLAVIGSTIEFVNHKTIGNTSSEELVDKVDNLESKIKSKEYYATGTDDNLVISQLVKDFFYGVGDYSDSSDTSSLRIFINGILGIGSLVDDKYIFDFTVSFFSNKRVFIDFSNATIPSIDLVADDSLIIVNSMDNVTVEKINIQVNSTSSVIYGVNGGTINDSIIDVIGDETSGRTIKIAYGCSKVSNCILSTDYALADAENCNVYGLSGCKKSFGNKIEMASGVSVWLNSKCLSLGDEINQSMIMDENAISMATIDNTEIVDDQSNSA